MSSSVSELNWLATLLHNREALPLNAEQLIKTAAQVICDLERAMGHIRNYADPLTTSR